MIPWEYQRLAQIIHEERIRAASRRRPEWMYELALSRKSVGFRDRFRTVLAQTLHQLAARLEPTEAIRPRLNTEQTSASQ